MTVDETAAGSEREPRLAACMEARREELGLEWVDVAERSGISDETIRSIRFGKTNPRSKTRAKVEAALQWQPGSIKAVMDGGDPQPLPPEDAPVERVERIAGPAALDGQEGWAEMSILGEFQEVVGQMTPEERVAFLRGVVAGARPLVRRKEEDDSE